MADLSSFFELLPPPQNDTEFLPLYDPQFSESFFFSIASFSKPTPVKPQQVHKPTDQFDPTRNVSFVTQSRKNRTLTYSTPYDFHPSIEMPPNFKASFDQTTIENSPKKSVIEANDIKITGRLCYIDNKKIKISVSKQFDIISAVPEVPFSIQEDPVFQNIASSESDELRIFADDKSLAAVSVCQKSVLPFDLIFEKSNQNVFVYPRSNHDNAVIDTNLECFVTPVSVQRGEATMAFQNHSKESTRLNRIFKSSMTTEKEKTFSDDKFSFVYREIKVEGLTFYVRVLVDALLEPDTKSKDEPDSERPLFVLCRTFNEVQTSFHQPNWKQDLEVKKGTLTTSEISCNSAKVARWVAASTFLNASHIILGFCTRKILFNPENHVCYGAIKYSLRQISSMVSLNNDNIFGVLALVFSKMKSLPDGKYVFVRETKKILYKLCEYNDK